MKKAYIAWEKNDSSSLFISSVSGEEANIGLMVDNKSTSSEVSNFSDLNEYYEMHTTFQQLYIESEKLLTLNNKLKIEYKVLEQKLEQSQQKEDTWRTKMSSFGKGETIIVECENCNICENKIVDLEKSSKFFSRSK